jgi:hypothetical protein
MNSRTPGSISVARKASIASGVQALVWIAHVVALNDELGVFVTFLRTDAVRNNLVNYHPSRQMVFVAAW